ncbi:MAG: hypothetical protein EPN98_24295 [Phenylobacterium sp.]|uniref:hypothetical protein n=1 Tax=Phenylobacterium sp. TaxID=1871053 RepID=UPI0011F615EF|nr:hypothetical protein [Phenylobacterium sp.]TAL28001.1 MAG: hypothetical protein EPN98_24295 [Phenylobacterium sp.]
MTQPLPEPKEIRAWPIIGGLVLGVVVCWVWITVALFVGFGASYGYDNNAAALAAVALAGLPVVLGIVFLVVPRTRQLGAGFLMGISIGFIAGAGVCASLFVPGTF